ncbi:MAG: DUF2807 domain-containing protein [Bacteroides sp.]|nr:DUF2807 domain-containing protein [Bacteroides sp.]
MKKSLFSLVIMLIGFGAAALSAETKNVNITQQFSELDLSAGVNVTYKPSSTTGCVVTITGEASRIENVDVRVSGKTLKISPKRDRNGNRNGKKIKGVTITVTAPMVNDIETSSGASFNCNATISLPSAKMELEASSGSSINFSSLNCRDMEIDASSGADVSIKNLTADNAEIEVSSGAAINVAKITAKNIVCDASSGGDIKVAGNSTNGIFSASSGGVVKASSLTVRNSKVKKSSGGSISVKSND